MPLDWERFKNVLELNTNDSGHEQLMMVVQHTEFLTSFLSQLSMELKQCISAIECVEKFPKAGSLLTLASTHDYIGSIPTIATLLIDCLLEYSKLDLDSEKDVSLDSTTLENKPIIWCIIRLRRLITAKPREENKLNAEKMIQKISDLIDLKGNQLTAQKISALTDTCLGLVHEEKAAKIIEKLVNCALVDTAQDDQSSPLLSETFIYQLVNDHSALRKLYRDSWPDDLKVKVLQNYNNVLEIEVLNLIDTYTNTNTSKKDDYIPPDELYHELMQTNFIQTIRSSPYLSQQVVQILADYIIRFSHWKLMRLGQSIYLCLSQTSKLHSAYNDFIKNASFQHVDARGMYNAILNYIYTEGSYLNIRQRRNEAWCMSMSFSRFAWYCVYTLVDWCHKENEPLTSQLEAILVYIDWMIYPTLNDPQSNNLIYLRNWIQTSQGNPKELYQKLPKICDSLLNNNGLILACFVTCLFYFLPNSPVDQCISLVESIYTKTEQYTFPETLKNNSDHCNTGLIYMLLDNLNDLEFHANIYPPLTFDVKQIKSFVYKKFI